MADEISIENILQKYLDKGFGSMTKNDFEIWIFHYLIQGMYKDYKDFDLSLALKIPETKVKRLRYEAELHYPTDNEAERRHKLKVAICQAKYKETKDGQIAFAIDEKMLRSYLQDCLRKGQRFYDSSFVSNIVVVSASDFLYILEHLVFSEEENKSIIDKVKKDLADDKKELPKSLSEISVDLAKGFSKELAKKFFGNSSDKLVDMLSANVIDSIKQAFINYKSNK